MGFSFNIFVKIPLHIANSYVQTEITHQNLAFVDQVLRATSGKNVSQYFRVSTNTGPKWLRPLSSQSIPRQQFAVPEAAFAA